MNDKELDPLRNFSIYLIKKDRKTIDEIVRPQSYSYDTLITHDGEKIGHLFVKQIVTKLPRWAAFFDGYIDNSQIGKVASSSAVLLVHSESRHFAFCFGQGRYLLDPDCLEERFGLLVALNSIGENSIKSIDKRSFDAISRHSREQASYEVGAQDFGLDIERDLLRAVTGSPSNPRLGNRLAGMDALNTTVRTKIYDIPRLLELYYEKFQDTSYKINFPWVEHLMEIKNRETCEYLDNLMVDIITKKEFTRCWLAAPDIIEWDQVDGFRYFSKKAPLHHDINFTDFIKSLSADTIIDLNILKNKYIYCIGEDDRNLFKWSVYKCIYCEIDDQNDSYLLSGGKWYRVTHDFVKEINDSYNNIPRYDNQLPEYNHHAEGEYNKHVASIDPESFALMDGKIIIHGGANNKIEFCDLYSKSGSLIHVKRYGASSVLSHLFSQGVVSGELFQTDAKFREKVNNYLPDTFKLDDITSPPSRGQYKIVYAIISDAPGDSLELPFFSRLNIRYAVRRLEGYGYKVLLAKINVNHELKITKRFK
jgi:uncharacterized protein (TIGR04141 family)